MNEFNDEWNMAGDGVENCGQRDRETKHQCYE